MGTFATGGLTEEVSGQACSVGPVQDCYSLQINTQRFTCDTAYTGGVSTTCWEQFVYQNTVGVEIWYFLFNYCTDSGGSNCDTAPSYSCPSMEPPASQGGTTYGWAKFEGVSCIAHIDYANPGFVFVPVTSLSDVSFTGSADYQGDGHDVATFCLLTDCETVSAPDGVLDLFQNWTQSEFNVFGDSGTAEAFFNPGTEITVTTDLTTGSGNPIPTTCGGGGRSRSPRGTQGRATTSSWGPAS